MFSLDYLFKTLGQLQLISIQFSSFFFLFFYKRTIQTSHCRLYPFDAEQYQKKRKQGKQLKTKVAKILAFRIATSLMSTVLVQRKYYVLSDDTTFLFIEEMAIFKSFRFKCVLELLLHFWWVRGSFRGCSVELGISFESDLLAQKAKP